MLTAELFQAQCDVIAELDINSLAAGRMHRLAIPIIHDGVGRPLHLPVVVVRGAEPGPVFGVTAVMHGNELNGIRIIQKLVHDLDPSRLRGTVVGCPVMNITAFVNHQRSMREGWDLNRLMPGVPEGHTGNVYAHRLMSRIVQHFNYIVDLHTASFGRVNSHYVRVNLTHPVASQMALLQDPEIIVHNEADDGTLRRACMKAGIPAITVEVGDPQRFQRKLIRDSLEGLRDVLGYLNMIDEDQQPQTDPPVVCRRSYWMYTQHGGILDVFPNVVDRVRKDELIARVTNIFGDTVGEYFAPEDGIVVGKSTNPVCETGSRIAHLGVVGEPPNMALK